MPPKAKVTREMIISAGFDIVREKGLTSLSARAVAQRLGCSTQPIMYHFEKLGELRRAVYKKADDFHSEYIMSNYPDGQLLSVGLAYIRFAVREKQLFRFLFQSGELSGESLSGIIGGEGAKPLISAVSRAANIDPEAAKEVFRPLFAVVHGYASLFANNSMEYDEKTVEKDLHRVFAAVSTVMED